ncbi:hypothetical protein [Paenibacillus pinihumi]|uniref:hypothetical protein n=1 Tax=Paenibacillus pinihumi TaxID=669462 RepID=UPI0004132117|nr:hypothetical protein [Paenibacillus pinihumi]
MNIQELQVQVKEGVVIREVDGVIYADFVEENGDEFRLTQSTDINEVTAYLEAHGLLGE